MWQKSIYYDPQILFRFKNVRDLVWIFSFYILIVFFDKKAEYEMKV